MRIAVLSHAPPATGTYTSSHRIAQHLSAGGHVVDVVEHWDPEVDEAAERSEIRGAELLIGTHAIQSGRVFLQTSQPFVLVLSGTDLNSGDGSPEADEAIDRAHAVVAYDQHHLEKAQHRWPTAEPKLRLVQKGVTTNPSAFSLRRHLGVPDDTTVCLLPSGLRPVKDVLYLADEFERWWRTSAPKRLVIVGLPRDPEYVERVHRYCATSVAVDLIAPLRQSDLHAAMRDADFVINSSLSESSPNAILEALHVGACVIARDIPGNSSIVRDRHHGMLFQDPSHFRAIVEGLDPLTVGRFRCEASEYALQHHSLERERDAYLQLVDEVMA